jgi:hypothetical protein
MFLREGKQFVAYTPVLDLSTSAPTFAKAKQRFAEAVQIFIEECHSMGTLDSVLQNLGWQKSKTSWKPPVIVGQDSIVFKLPAFA